MPAPGSEAVALFSGLTSSLILNTFTKIEKIF